MCLFPKCSIGPFRLVYEIGVGSFLNHVQHGYQMETYNATIQSISAKLNGVHGHRTIQHTNDIREPRTMLAFGDFCFS
jgi:hypothetical protein